MGEAATIISIVAILAVYLIARRVVNMDLDLSKLTADIDELTGLVSTAVANAKSTAAQVAELKQQLADALAAQDFSALQASIDALDAKVQADVGALKA